MQVGPGGPAEGSRIEMLDGTDIRSALEARITGPLGLEATIMTGHGVASPERLAAGWLPDLS